MRHPSRSIAIATLTALLAACKADTVVAVDTGPLGTAALQQNVASVSSAFAGDQVSAIGSALAGAGVSAFEAPAGGASLVMAAVAAGCTGPNGAGYFVCTSRSERGLTVVRQFRFFAQGAVATGPGNNIDSLQHIWSTTGRDTASEGSKTRLRIVSRTDTGTSIMTRDTTPARNVTRFLNNGRGTALDTVIFTDSGKTVRFIYAGRAVVANVVRKAPESANPFPFSGTITLTLSVQALATSEGKSESKSFDDTVVVTFNGTRFAVLNARGKTCSLDLVTRTASQCQ